MKRNRGQMVSTCWEVGRDRRKVCLGTDLEDEAHTDDDVEEEVTVEDPEAGVVGSEPEDDVAVIRDSDGVLRRREISLF